MINIEDRINDRGVKVIDYKDYKGNTVVYDRETNTIGVFQGEIVNKN